MRWLKIGLVLSLVGAGYGLYVSRFFPIFCCGSIALVLAFLVWVLGRRTRYFQNNFDPNELYLSRKGYISGARIFVDSAQELVEYRVNRAAFIPFTSRWPMYGQMDINQLDWYFYWRDQVRNGNFPKTDSAYIYMLAHELINDVGVINLQLGYELLFDLWKNYRLAHPALDENLADWVVDYAALNNLAPAPEDVYKHLSTADAATVDWILQARIAEGWENLPMTILERLTNHKIARSSFVKAGYGEAVEIANQLALKAVDAHLQQGIWQTYRPQSPVIDTRKPFAGAIYAGLPQSVAIGEVYMASKHKPLRDFLTGVVKYAENKLRAHAKFRGRLQVKGLDMSLQQLIDQVMERNLNATNGVQTELLKALEKIANRPISAEIDLP